MSAAQSGKNPTANSSGEADSMDQDATTPLPEGYFPVMITIPKHQAREVLDYIKTRLGKAPFPYFFQIASTLPKHS